MASLAVSIAYQPYPEAGSGKYVCRGVARHDRGSNDNYSLVESSSLGSGKWLPKLPWPHGNG